MGRDYTKIPGYETLTPLSARYNYMHDLLEQYKLLSKDDINKMVGCRRKEIIGDCRYCSFSGFLGGDIGVTCNWRAEAEPDRAITILEFLRERDKGLRTVPKPAEETGAPVRPNKADMCHQIAEHCGLASQMDVAQEEAAELIQALSKYRRVCAKVGVADEITEEALDHVSEEMADCYIMLEQLRYLLQNHTEVDKWMSKKLKRTVNKIEKGEL